MKCINFIFSAYIPFQHLHQLFTFPFILGGKCLSLQGFVRNTHQYYKRQSVAITAKCLFFFFHNMPMNRSCTMCNLSMLIVLSLFVKFLPSLFIIPWQRTSMGSIRYLNKDYLLVTLNVYQRENWRSY